MTCEVDDPSLWARLQSARPEVSNAALEALWGSARGTMYAISLRLLNDRAMAEEAVQEAVCRLVKSIRRIRPDGSRLELRRSPRLYLVRIVHNVCVEWLRKEHPTIPVALVDPVEDRLRERKTERPEAMAIAHEQQDAIDSAMQELPEWARTVIVLRFKEEYGLEAIAEVLGMRKNAVEVRLSRAVRKLKDLVDRRKAQTESDLEPC